MWGPLLAYIRKQLGQNTDAASKTGSMSARFNYVLADYYATASDTLRASADTTRAHTSTSYVLKKAMIIPKNGQYRVKFSIWASSTTAYGRIYKNGVAYGTERSTTNTSPTEFSEDLFFGIGDEIQIYTKNNSGKTVSLSNFRIYYDLVAGGDAPITSYDA